jgi:hypothetical protein
MLWIIASLKKISYYLFSLKYSEMKLLNEVLKEYSNLGFDYPVRDTAGLRKLYKELKSQELKPLI